MNIISSSQEYIRAAQRDQEVMRTWRGEMLLAAERWLGVRTLGKYMNEIALFADFAYYLLTLCVRNQLNQTLGEEYVAVSLASYGQVKKVRRVIGSKNYVRAAALFAPGMFKVLVYILLKLGLPYIIRQWSRQRDKEVRNREIKTWWDFLPSLEDVWEQVFEKTHFSVFLLTGMFDDIAKRVTKLVYLRHYRALSEAPNFTRLGYIVLAHAMINLVVLTRQSVNAYKRYGQTRALRREEEADEGMEGRCGLCLSTRKTPSAPPCGHIFCWDCLITATQVKPECPECRQPAEPKTVLQLRNLT